MTNILLVDIEALLVTYLKAQTAISTLVSTRVSTELPSSATFPYLTLFRSGGIPDKPLYADHPQVQLDAWGRTKSEASNLARVAYRVCMEVPQGHGLGAVTDCTPSLGMLWFPDSAYEPPKPRYTFGFIFTTHP